MIQHALEINPQAPEALFDLATYVGYLANDSTAQDYYERAAALSPGNQWYQEVLGNYYQTHNQLDKAIGILEKMSQDQPENPDFLYGLLQMYTRKQDFGKCIDVLNNIEKLEGKSENLSMNKFRMYLQLEQKDKAFAEVESLTREYPNDLRYKVVLGDLYLDNEDASKAYELYQQVLAEEPQNVSAQVSLSSYYEKTGDSAKAKDMMEKLVLNPASDSQTRVQVMRKIIYDSEAQKRDSTYVLGLFDQLLSVPQEDVGIALLCTQYKLQKQMPEPEITASLRQVVQLDPTNNAARIQLLDYAFRRNDYADAAQLCKESIEYSPEELAYYYYMGASLMQLEKKEEALDILLKGVEQINDKSDKSLACSIYGSMGDIYHEMNDSEKTYEAYDKALTYNPDDTMVLNNYAYYLSLEKKDLDKAEEMSFRTVKINPKSFNELDTYAWILFIKGKYTEARIYIDESLKNGGDKEGNIVEHAGDIYSLSGEMEKALEFWQQADSLGAESKTLKQKIKLKKYIE
ncbi:MAG: tetratricopeptide repeat protein [Bacteroidaceae bacterium]|nr:tetratricopeptide repeat protein [Bacteroidaceae bacterium]